MAIVLQSPSSLLNKWKFQRDSGKRGLEYEAQAEQMAAKQGVSSAMEGVARQQIGTGGARTASGIYAGDGAGAQAISGRGPATVKVKVGSDSLRDLAQANLKRLRTQELDAEYDFKSGNLRRTRMGDANNQAYRSAIGQKWDENSMSYTGPINRKKQDDWIRKMRK